MYSPNFIIIRQGVQKLLIMPVPPLKASYPQDLLEMTLKCIIFGQAPIKKVGCSCIIAVCVYAVHPRHGAAGFGTKVFLSCRFRLSSICKMGNSRDPLKSLPQ